MNWRAPDLLPPPTTDPSAPLPPPAAPPPPPAPEDPADPGERSGVPAATWIALLGGALVLLAATSVVVANWDAIGRTFRVIGLVGGTGALLFASERVRRVAPNTANIVAHVGTFLTTTVGVAALSLFGVTWPGCLVAGGALALAATVGQAGRWSPSLFRIAQVGAIAIAATGLGEITGTTGGLIAALAAVALLTIGAERRAVGLAALALLSPALTALADAGVGAGTFERAGLVGDRLGWSGPVVGVLAAIVLGVAGWRRRNSGLVAGAALAPVVGIVTGLAAVDGSAVAWLCLPALALVAGELARWAAPEDRWRRPISAGIDAMAATVAGVALLAPLAAAELVLDTTLAFPWAVPLAATAFALVLVTTRWHREDDRLVDLGIAAVAAVTLAVLVAFAVDPLVTVAAAAALVAGSAFASRRLHPAAIGVPAIWALVEIEQLVGDVWSMRWWVGLAAAMVVAGIVVASRARQAAGGDIAGWVEMIAVTGAGAVCGAMFAEGGHVSAALAGAAVIGTAAALLERRWIPLQLVATAVVGLATLDAAFDGAVGGQHAWAAWVAATLGLAGTALVHRSSLAAHGAASAAVATGTAAAAALDLAVQDIVAIAMGAVAVLTGLALTVQRRSPLDSAAATAGIVLAIAGSFTGPSPWLSGAWVVLGLQIAGYGAAMRRPLVTAGGSLIAGIAAVSWWFTTGLDEWFRELVAPLDITVADVWLFAVTSTALALGWIARRVFAVNSWVAYSVGLFVGGLWLVSAQIDRDPVWAVPAAITFGVTAAGVGAWHRLAAPLVGGTVITALSTFVALGSDLSAIPTWSWLALGGLSLLGTAVTIERTSKQGTSLHDLIDHWH